MATKIELRQLFVTNGDWGDGATNKVQRVLREELRVAANDADGAELRDHAERLRNTAVFLSDHVRFTEGSLTSGVSITSCCDQETLDLLVLACQRHWPKSTVEFVVKGKLVEAEDPE